MEGFGGGRVKGKWCGSHPERGTSEGSLCQIKNDEG
jgi:hypothetical protein